MNKKIVLFVEEDSYRVSNFIFSMQLGGYEIRTFNNDAAALNWVKYACTEEEPLCLLFNVRIGLERVEQIISLWTVAAMTLPVVFVQRGKGDWNNLLPISANDHFYICEPESVMQTLDVLAEIRPVKRCTPVKCATGRTSQSEGIA